MLGSSLETRLHRVVQVDMKGIRVQQNTNVATTVNLYAHENSSLQLLWAHMARV